jgi:hypothetical protein
MLLSKAVCTTGDLMRYRAPVADLLGLRTRQPDCFLPAFDRLDVLLQSGGTLRPESGVIRCAHQQGITPATASRYPSCALSVLT